ncbi:ATP-binding protein [Streptosporangium sandarakinum]|uniref:ATP-binding protein n=1 Tax=Streptosporangium sandarakinum TaxID=1260955 RepID=UPI0033A79F49
MPTRRPGRRAAQARRAQAEAHAPRMRRYVRDLLDDTEHPHTDDALLLVTELVTNSVRHSDSGRVPGGRVVVAVADHAGTLHIEVIDAGSEGCRPALRPDIDGDGSGGRGRWGSLLRGSREDTARGFRVRHRRSLPTVGMSVRVADGAGGAG